MVYGEKRLARSVTWWGPLLLLLGCVGYQAEPYIGLSLRDEEFTAPGGADGYEGWTYQVGMRYVPPVRVDEVQLMSLAPKPITSPVPVVVEHNDEGELGGMVESLNNVTSYAVGFAILATSLLVWVYRRKPKAEES